MWEEKKTLFLTAVAACKNQHRLVLGGEVTVSLGYKSQKHKHFGGDMSWTWAGQETKQEEEKLCSQAAKLCLIFKRKWSSRSRAVGCIRCLWLHWHRVSDSYPRWHSQCPHTHCLYSQHFNISNSATTEQRSSWIFDAVQTVIINACK